MSTAHTNSGRGGRLLSVLLAGFFTGVVMAAAPVEESVPVGGRRAVVNVVPPMARVEDSDVNPTAHLLNTIDQLRQEVMEIRGQLEEYSFRVDQMQQDSRDRYVDLDDRISRLSDAKESRRSAPAPTEVREQSAQQAEKAVYENAFAYIRAKQFDQAKKALQRQLQDYPDGKYADNAYYWLGEVDMAKGLYDDARISFEMVLTDFPESSKVPDACYKLGRVYDMLGDSEKSRQALLTVIQQYPQSAAARLSETYLATMQ